MDITTLNGEWELIERPLTDGAEAAADVQADAAELIARVPGDVNDALVRAGRLPEPLKGTNFRRFEWVRDRSWWFRKRFATPAGCAEAAGAELFLDGLDVHADIWLNGQYLGHHASAFYPFEHDIASRLAPEGAENVLLLRLTCGAERTPEEPDFPLLDAVPTEAGRGYPDRGFKKRIYLRKPAYVWGWDWGPPLPTCGITGNAMLRCRRKAEIGRVSLRAGLDGDDAEVQATVELEYATLTDSAWGTVRLELTDEDGVSTATALENVFIRSGRTLVDLSLPLPRARLWWPNGSGGQHRYTVTVSAEIEGQHVEHPPFRYGVRTVEMINRPGRFGFAINGTPVFIKGGNWIPPDSLYGRVTDEKVTRLVEEAAEANFNCLRIWGGGRFELDAFYDACDRLGILVWHDFMSACAPLPAHEPWFEQDFMREADYQVRRLHNRASLLLWCGNNEVGGCYSWFRKQFAGAKDPGWRLYHERLPRLVHDLAPHVPYWPTSPYGGTNGVGDARTGDDHHWVVMRPDSRFWSHPEYWDGLEIPIFNSEYGYGGPCCIESTRQYLGADAPDLFSAAGKEHTNTFYDIPRVNFSIKEHYRDPEGLNLDAYILLGGLCQGLNLGYSLESLRANEQSLGGIFWMYNDTWGENGWTIIDYYLRRKISYYNVKRCLAPRRLVLRRGGQAFGGKSGEVVVVALNDGASPWSGRFELGYIRYDGKERRLQSVDFEVPPRTRRIAASCPAPSDQELAHGTVVAVPTGNAPAEAVAWRHCRYREAGLPPARVKIVSAAVQGDDLHVTLRSDSYAHAVHLDIPGDYRCSDQYFDLLPGEVRRIAVYGAAALNAEALAAVSVNG